MDDPTNTAGTAAGTTTGIETITSITEIAAAGSFTEVSSNFASYVLAEIRCAGIRARLIENAIVAADLALKSGLIGAEDALEFLADAPGALALVAPSSTSPWATWCSS
jgi:hypothetical protein